MKSDLFSRKESDLDEMDVAVFGSTLLYFFIKATVSGLLLLLLM